jgi:DNA invertase Pin-like site-specific DNA recombinase
MAKVTKPKATPRRGKNATGQRVGYMRVSTLDQNENRQLEGVKLDRTFLDRASGKDVHRPQLIAMLAFVREGDTVICHSMDRLGRNLDDLRKLVLGMTERGVQVQFVKESLTFTGRDSPMANLLLSVMGAFAQFERELIRERQREGIALAKRAGVYTGRKRVLSTERAAELTRRLAAGEEKAALSREFAVNRATVYRYLGRAASETNNKSKTRLVKWKAKKANPF